VQDSKGKNKMRNKAHTNKFVGPEAPLKGIEDLPSQQLERPEQVEQDQPNPTASQPPAQSKESPPSPNPSPGDSVALRHMHAR